MLLCSGCTNSAGLRAAPLPSTIAGRKHAKSATPRSQPSSSGSRLMSLSRVERPQLSRQSRRQRSRRSSSWRRETRSAPVSSRAWHDQAATLPARQARRPILVPNDLILCARLSPLSADMLDMREVAAAARTLGVEVVTLEIQRAEDIAPAFDALKGRADALYVCGEPLVNTNRVRINTLALGAQLPTMFGLREYVEAGGLMSYGPNQADLYRRAADYVDKILRGAKPADIPVEQPTKFYLIINLTAAKALGLDVPPSLLARADEVIE